MKTQLKGFSLIEVLIVAGLGALLTLTATTLFATFMVSSSQTKLHQQLKKEGNQALSQMEFLIRNAKSLSENNQGDICTTGMTSLGFESFAGGKGILYQDGDSIASDSGVIGSPTSQTYLLTSNQVDVSTSNPLEFDCYTTPSGENLSYYIDISFSLETDAEQSVVNKTATQDFSRGIQLRNLSEL